MAIAKSNRFGGRIARSPDRRRATRNRQRSRGRRKAARVPTEPPFEQSLLAIGLRLRMIYGTAITAQLALREQAAAQDKEIADCLREGVCNPLSDEIGKVDELIRRFVTGKPAAFFPRAREAGDYRLGFTTGASDDGERSTAAQCADVGRTGQATEGERAVGASLLPARGDQRVDALRVAVAAGVGPASTA